MDDAIQPVAGGFGTAAMPQGIASLGTTTGPRRKTNEDRACSALISRPPSDGGPLYIAVVCDGIGGERDGEKSAALAISTFVAACAASSERTAAAVLSMATRAANEAVYSLTRGQGGTTLVALGVTADGRASIINCGDSRAYVIKPASGIRQLTHDQTLSAAIRQAEPQFPSKLEMARFESELGNFVGIGPDMRPELISHQLQGDESVLLASDGTWGALGVVFDRIFLSGISVNECVRRVLVTVNYADGADNATLVLTASMEKLLSELRKIRIDFSRVNVSASTPAGSFVISYCLPVLQSREEPAPPILERTKGKGRKGKGRSSPQQGLDLGSAARRRSDSRGRRAGTRGKAIEVVEGSGRDGKEDPAPE